MRHSTISEILSRLSQWYSHERDKYSFRKNRTPYSTWVTEIFLQQTQISAAQEKLTAFLKKFPTIASLASAEESAVLEAFRGMGYYSRARNLHKGAKEIILHYGGKMPREAETLEKISGIGRYTAAIIASIFNGEKILSLDANHARVLSRLFAVEDEQGTARFEKTLREKGAYFLNEAEDAGEFNEALMQWGQTICKKKPLCHICFAAQFCRAYEKGEEGAFPRKKPPRVPVEILWEMFLIKKDGLYGVVQSPVEFPFLRGELLFPSIVRDSNNHIKGKLPKGLLFSLANERGVREVIQPIEFTHSITHHRIRVVLRASPAGLKELEFFSCGELLKRCHSSLMQKALKAIDNAVPAFF